MRIVQTRHGFKASERSYRTQLRKWGYMKYNVQDNPPSRPKPSTSKRNRSSGGADAHVTISSTPSLESRDLGASLVNSVNVSATSFHIGRIHNSYFRDQTPLPDQSTTLERLWVRNSHMWPEVEVRNLFLAVHSQHEEEVERALSEGSLANSQDAQGIGALYYAASGTSSKIVSLLLNHGADVNAKGHSGQTPLHRAASNATITHLLLAAGADVNARDLKWRRQALSMSLSTTNPLSTPEITWGSPRFTSSWKNMN
ncbi:Ankyrin repeat domain-containing protein 7 [Colletotrichum fructicola]|nr:Ankyrin repeat domain-containing protein 7 [Colletotrichum fructicola]